MIWLGTIIIIYLKEWKDLLNSGVCMFSIYSITELEKKQEIIDFLFSNDLISKSEYIMAKKIRKAFRQQKFLDLALKYKEVFTVGGKSNSEEKLIDIVESQRQWNEIKTVYNDRDLRFIETFIGKSNSVKKLLKKIRNKKVEIEKILYKLMVCISKYLYFNRKKINLTYNDIIFMLKWLVKEKGIVRVEKETGINRRTVKKIIIGNKNFNYEKYINLCKYFDLVLDK